MNLIKIVKKIINEELWLDQSRFNEFGQEEDFHPNKKIWVHCYEGKKSEHVSLQYIADHYKEFVDYNMELTFGMQIPETIFDYDLRKNYILRKINQKEFVILLDLISKYRLEWLGNKWKEDHPQ